MNMLARAITVALGTVGFVASAHAATYVVTANQNQFDQKLAAQVEAAGGTITARLPQIGVAIVESPHGDFAQQAGRISGLRSVIADVDLQFEIPDAVDVRGEQLQPDFANPPNSGDNDTRFDLQWGAKAIDVAGAWNAGHRGAGATVAVLDSGIACVHPDLAANIDHASSASFVPGESYCRALVSGFNHGSHVAGIIASPDNGIGTIGVAPLARIMAVKVLSERTGSGSFAGIIQGIVHATDHGADVINMSLGVRGGLLIGGSDIAELVNATKRATIYARQKGTLVVASAGNDARDLDNDANLRAFPAELPGVLAVSATAPEGWGTDLFGADLDKPASYTNYGQSAIDFAGPGGDFDYDNDNDPTNPDINCTVAGLTRPCWVFDGVFAPGGYFVSGGTVFASYSWSAGTSMAAPHVSGVAALIYGKHPGIKASQVEAILRMSSDDLGKPGNDDYYGTGRVNAAQAVE